MMIIKFDMGDGLYTQTGRHTNPIQMTILSQGDVNENGRLHLCKDI